MTLLVDTTVLIGVLRNHQPTVARLDAVRDPPFVSAISVEELLRGARPHEHDATERLLEWMVVAEVGEREARQAAMWRNQYAALGRSLPQADTLIAACAHGRGATVATANLKDFPMEELRVEHWP
ncbi:MAG TPA: PIN domain-containing protein [Solirubrobacteraceae bacterium]|nr:PIN domain-containing protein [Solirubrobacteraceae bacterium]